ncbi:TetR/AcrR family transcriptional regulator C-terminal domain-containing protein [Streptomyces sp. 150FB]|uniref:TetR/AcrR family transcriptional regulator C-terminal domain-containing protein n=1 Tax=Streptomyces sp. 150FB TaxID=1576605 RepID=UPI00322198C5
MSRRLGVRLNTVSWHVKSKARLRELMADAIIAGVSLDGLPTDWRERATVLSGRCRAALLARRDGARLVAGTFTAEPATLRVAEALLRALLDGGLPVRAAGWACWTVVSFVLGLAQEQQGSPGPMADVVGSALSPEKHPSLTPALPYLVDGAFETRFAFGLDLILDSAARLGSGGTDGE